MKTVTEFQNKNILVLGIAKVVMQTTLLQKLGANVIVNDGKPLAENVLAQNYKQKEWTLYAVVIL